MYKVFIQRSRDCSPSWRSALQYRRSSATPYEHIFDGPTSMEQPSLVLLLDVFKADLIRYMGMLLFAIYAWFIYLVIDLEINRILKFSLLCSFAPAEEWARQRICWDLSKATCRCRQFV